MNAADPLANLRDIHLPDPVTAWPPAIGWWLLGFIIIAAIVGLIWFLRRRYKKHAYRREALDRLSEIRTNANASDSPVAVATEVSGLLKQVAMTLFGRHQTASLNGSEWLKFLDEKGKTDAFTQGPGRILGDDIYRPDVEVDIDSLFEVSKQWISKQS